jgi:hypothetical protein
MLQETPPVPNGMGFYHEAASFRTLIKIMKNSPDNHVLQEIDGDHRPDL